MNILVTSGATREAIDGVRFITNFSTGSTGAAITDALREAGHSVFYLHGRGAALPSRRGRAGEFSDFAGLDSALRSQLGSGRFDAVIHLAAVSDYSVASVEAKGRDLPPDVRRKLDSGGDIVLHLRRNFKIVDRLSGYARGRRLYVAAFKLTCARSARERARAAAALSLRPVVNAAVHNDMLDIRAGKRAFTIYVRGRAVSGCRTPRRLAGLMISAIKEAKHAAGS